MAETRALLPVKQQKGAARLIFDAQSKFAAEEIPSELLLAPPDDEDVVTGSGTWRLINEAGRQNVRLTFETVSAGPRPPLPYDIALHIGTGRELTLFYFHGDADEGRRIVFKKN